MTPDPEERSRYILLFRPRCRELRGYHPDDRDPVHRTYGEIICEVCQENTFLD